MKKYLSLWISRCKKIHLNRIHHYLMLGVIFLKFLPQLRLKTIPGFLRNFILDNLIFSNKKVFIHIRKLDLKFFLKNYWDVFIIDEVVVKEVYSQYNMAVKGGKGVVVDIGAGIGDFSILTSKKNPKTEIYAFEPDAASYSAFLLNKVLNSTQNITSYRKRVLSLNQIFKTADIKICHLLKIDCEGCEFEIITHTATALLKKIEKIVIEYHETNIHKSEQLMKILTKANFNVTRIPNPKKLSSNLGYIYGVNLKYV